MITSLFVIFRIFSLFKYLRPSQYLHTTGSYSSLFFQHSLKAWKKGVVRPVENLSLFGEWRRLPSDLKSLYDDTDSLFTVLFLLHLLKPVEQSLNISHAIYDGHRLVFLSSDFLLSRCQLRQRYVKRLLMVLFASFDRLIVFVLHRLLQSALTNQWKLG